MNDTIGFMTGQFLEGKQFETTGDAVLAFSCGLDIITDPVILLRSTSTSLFCLGSKDKGKNGVIV